MRKAVMKKSNIVEIYNKSAEKSFIILKESVVSGRARALGNMGGPELVCIDPGVTVGIEEKIASKLLKGYPEYLMLMGSRTEKKLKKK